MYKAYKVEIKPTKEQIQKIHQTMGVCRFVYNLFITKNKEVYESDKKFFSGFDFSKWLNNTFIPENPEYSWIKEVSAQAIQDSMRNAEVAFKKFFKGQSKFPRYKKKTDSISVKFPKNSPTSSTVERHRVKVPNLGFIRLKQYGYIPLDAIVKSATISKVVDSYFVSILVVEETEVTPKNTNEGLGIDLGVKEFAIVSNGSTFKNINKSLKVKKLQKQLKRAQRNFSRKLENNKKFMKKEANRNISKNKLRLQKLHYKLGNIRREYTKAVVNSLVSQSPKFIAIEDLNVKGMVANRHLSKAVQEQNFYYFRVFLTQQAKKYNIEVRVIDRWYPSSKTCSCCGHVKGKLSLSERTFVCEECGESLDRDLNASINIKNCKTYKTT